MIDLKTCDWHQLNRTLCGNLRICYCQRRLKNIVTLLKSIKDKCKASKWDELTPEELFITSLLDSVPGDIILHGVNCEYPFIGISPLWDYIEDMLQNPNLEDN